MELEPFDMSLVNTIEKLDKFLVDVDHPVVKANIDCSHLWLMGLDASEILKLKGRIIHTHFSDCNGKTHGDLPPGRGNTPLVRYLQALSRRASTASSARAGVLAAAGPDRPLGDRGVRGDRGDDESLGLRTDAVRRPLDRLLARLRRASCAGRLSLVEARARGRWGVL